MADNNGSANNQDILNQMSALQNTLGRIEERVNRIQRIEDKLDTVEQRTRETENRIGSIEAKQPAKILWFQNVAGISGLLSLLIIAPTALEILNRSGAVK
jgi:chromosome segregation ATPase